MNRVLENLLLVFDTVGQSVDCVCAGVFIKCGGCTGAQFMCQPGRPDFDNKPYAALPTSSKTEAELDCSDFENPRYNPRGRWGQSTHQYRAPNELAYWDYEGRHPRIAQIRPCWPASSLTAQMQSLWSISAGVAGLSSVAWRPHGSSQRSSSAPK